MSHASWTAGKGQRAPTFSPFLLFCNRIHLPSTHFGMLQGPRCGGLPAAPGASRGSQTGVPVLAPAVTASSGPPLPSSGTPLKACGDHAPSGQGHTPALPGEVCKHSCSRAREPLEVRPQGYTARGRGQEGTGRGRRQHGRRPGDPPPLRRPPPSPCTQPGERPRTHQNLLGSRGKRVPSTPSRKDTPALPAFHGKGEGANLDVVRRPKLSRVAFHSV